MQVKAGRDANCWHELTRSSPIDGALSSPISAGTTLG